MGKRRFGAYEQVNKRKCNIMKRCNRCGLNEKVCRALGCLEHEVQPEDVGSFRLVERVRDEPK